MDRCRAASGQVSALCCRRAAVMPRIWVRNWHVFVLSKYETWCASATLRVGTMVPTLFTGEGALASMHLQIQ